MAALVAMAAAATAAGARELGAGEAEVELRGSVQAMRHDVRLGDIAFVRTTDLGLAQRLVSLPVGEAPRVGSDATLDRAALARWLRLRVGLSPQRVHWLGPDRVQVRRAAAPLASARVEQVARAALEEWLARSSARFSVEPAGSAQDVAVPPGDLRIVARPLAAGTRATPRMVVWADLWVDGAFVRAMPVSFQVETFDASPAPITVKRVAAVSRGEAVTLHLQAGPVTLQGRGEAMQAGEAGQLVRVRMAGAAQDIQARVLGQGQVEVTP